VALPAFTDGEETAALLAASAVIRGYCRWHIWPQLSETFVIDGPGTRLLRLPTREVSAVASIVETQRGSGQVPITLTVATDVDWSRNGTVERVDGHCWTRKMRGVTVTATHGFLELPADVADIATSLAASASGNPSRLKRMQIGERSADYSGAGLLEDDMRRLDPYRRLS
jgi:hypothetical protein